MVVSKKKVAKVPLKGTKKPTGSQVKIVKGKKNVSVNNRGAAKRPKMIKPTKPSKTPSNVSETRSMVGKNKKSSDNISLKGVKEKKLARGDGKSSSTKQAETSPKKSPTKAQVNKTNKHAHVLFNRITHAHIVVLLFN